MEKIHFKLLDVAKFVACLLIVMRHCQPCGVRNVMSYCIQMITTFPIPFFFAVSSFLYWHRGSGIKHYLSRLGVLYIVWFVIELPVVISRFFVPEPDFVRFFSDLFFHNTFYASWYIMASLFGIGIVWVLSRRLNNFWLFAIGFVFFVLCLVYSTYHDVFIGTWLGTTVDQLGEYITFSNSFFSAIIYIVIGKVIADDFEKFKDEGIKHDVVLMVLFAVLYFIEYISLRGLSLHSQACRLSLIPFTYYLVRICVKNYKMKIPREEWAKYFRISSILMYLMHPLLLIGFTCITQQDHNWLQYFIVVAVAMFLSWVIPLYSKKYKVLKFLY